ncbi:hypothetical protein [Streptomyces cavernicola]|uniref:Uncharacterized protein n=1 Tax=Streptomyces cavernicola TaxID=3043613 RepID=A0ABT6SNC8_9ACTN|nr:hypothetical protein [Streptomyces sp. B-S-A6]MDI3408746.1 hypothetical protein [Streptomyces sp. B-S-A6]
MDLDELLVGHWSSLPLSYGVMEASELGFLGDGWGWSTWFNVGGMCVTRFEWRCPALGIVELRARWRVEGTPGPGAGPVTFASAEPPEPVDDLTRRSYRIGPVVPMPGAEAVPAVTFEEPVEFCHEYARGAVRIRREEEPAHRLLPDR